MRSIFSRLDHYFWIIFLLGLIAITVALCITLVSRSSGYAHISAITRSITINSKLEQPDWFFDNATVVLDETSTEYENITIFFSYKQIIFVHQNENGDVTVSVSGPNDCNSLDECISFEATLNGEQVVESLPGQFQIKPVKSSKTNSNGFRGEVIIGNLYSDSTENEFLSIVSGKISLYGKHTFGRDSSHYEAEPISLTYGDKATIGSIGSLTHGTVTLNANKLGLTVSATSSDTIARVTRYNTDEIILKNGWLSRLYNDRGLAAIWSLVFIIINFCTWVVSEVRK